MSFQIIIPSPKMHSVAKLILCTNNQEMHYRIHKINFEPLSRNG